MSLSSFTYFVSFFFLVGVTYFTMSFKYFSSNKELFIFLFNSTVSDILDISFPINENKDILFVPYIKLKSKLYVLLFFLSNDEKKFA